MAKKKVSTSPFRGYSVEEVLESEACSYVIQVGSDLFEKDGMLVFSKKNAITHYNRILKQVYGYLDSGTRKEKESAKRVLMNLRVLPLRIN